MENVAAKLTAAFFDSKGIKYRIDEERPNIIRVIYSAENYDGQEFLLRFNDESTQVTITGYNFVKFPAAKKDIMYKVCNDINAKFRWAKFYVDEDDNTITVQLDAMIQLDTVGEETKDCLSLVVDIADDAYPEFMRGIYV